MKEADEPKEPVTEKSQPVKQQRKAKPASSQRERSVKDTVSKISGDGQQQILNLQQKLIAQEKELAQREKNNYRLEMKLADKDKEISDLKGAISMSANESQAQQSFHSLKTQLNQQE